jgi:hypothetical protein
MSCKGLAEALVQGLFVLGEPSNCLLVQHALCRCNPACSWPVSNAQHTAHLSSLLRYRNKKTQHCMTGMHAQDALSRPDMPAVSTPLYCNSLALPGALPLCCIAVVCICRLCGSRV